MKTVINLFNLPDALNWVHYCQEIFSVFCRAFTSPDKNLKPLLLTARVR